MNVAAYIRVSTPQQNLEVQAQEVKRFCDFRNYNIVSFYEDKESGKDIKRHGFGKFLQDIEINPFGIEAIVIFKLDRIGRSVKDLIYISSFLNSKKIGLVSISDNIDTTTKEGRLFFHMMSSFAEYERELITERTMLGRLYSKEKGTVFGRPSKRLEIEKIQQNIASGIPLSKIARNLNISRTTLYKNLKKV